MVEDNYIIGHLYVPIMMIILLMAMIYFHWRHVLKYLYLVNIFCFLVSVSSYFVLMGHPVGYDDPRLWMQAMPFLLLIGLLGGYVLFLASIAAFVIEHAQRQLWARIIIGIAGLILIALGITGVYLLIQGIISLKSG